jgi:hypothetical protein
VPVFVHIADARDGAAIRRSGLKIARMRKAAASEGRPAGIFALPVVPDFTVTHQWLRELKTRGYREAVGIYFRLPKDEPVWAGHYTAEKQSLTAAAAASELRRGRMLGYEVIIPRGIAAREITAVRALPQVLGWRYFPGAHERGIFCGCSCCQRGAIKSRRLQEKWES